jgi:hypothetical protein
MTGDVITSLEDGHRGRSFHLPPCPADDHLVTKIGQTVSHPEGLATLSRDAPAGVPPRPAGVPVVFFPRG